MNANNPNNETIFIVRRGLRQVVYVGAKVMIQEQGMTWWNGKIVAINVQARMVRVDYSADWGNNNEVQWHSVNAIVNVIY